MRGAIGVAIQGLCWPVRTSPRYWPISHRIPLTPAPWASWTVCCIRIHENTPIPVTKSEVVSTLHDQQKEVEVNVYQGEAEDAQENIQIGEFIVTGLSKVPAGNPIIIQLALNADGILQMLAREMSTGLEKSITIRNVLLQIQEDELSEAREHIGALFEDAAFANATKASPATEN